MKRLLALWLSVVMLSESAPAVEISGERYDSGLVKTFVTHRPSVQEQFPSRNGEALAVGRFLAREYGVAEREGYRWQNVSHLRDASHTHWIYELRYGGRRIADQYLKVHTHHAGWVQYASSSWKALYSLAVPSMEDTNEQVARARAALLDEFRRKHGDRPVRIAIEPVIWIDERFDKDGRPVSALEVTMTSESVGVYRKFYLDQRTLEPLEEKRVVRGAEIYKVNPLRDSAATSTVTVVGSPTATLARDSQMIVRREVKTGATTALIDVDPTLNYGTPDNDTADYAGTTCLSTGTTATDCPNQAFDVVNVMYHLQQYRSTVDAYYAQIGAPTNLFTSSAGKKDQDPLHVIVNLMSIDFNGDGSTNETNNAAFVPIPCRSDNSIEKCLVFLRPTLVISDLCGSGTITFNNLARESLVITHEYQHYVTDTVTKMVAGGSLSNVGDVLHEGYSDYFAASHISNLAGSAVTEIGEYAFKNCAYFRRDVAIPRVYKNDADDKDPHNSGLTWASGLWVLRTEFGRDIADKIAYKSQFFLPVRPGFIDAVEALVKADDALFAGAHRSRIRGLFYSDLKFIGGQSGVFRDVENQVAEIGFRSCAATARSSSGEANAMPHLSGVLLVLWLGVTVLLSRLCSRRSE